MVFAPESNPVLKEVSSEVPCFSGESLVLVLRAMRSLSDGVEEAAGSKGFLLSGSGSGSGIFWIYIYGSFPVGVFPDVIIIIIIIIPFFWDERVFISCLIHWIITAFSHHKYTYEF